MLLTNKSIELVSCNPSVLSVIIPAFIKLIYPAKYENSIIPVLPIGESYNKKYGKHFFGLINNNENFFNNLTNKNCVVIDCDVNQMYNYKKYNNFCPLPSSELSKNKNLILRYYKNKLMKYNFDKNLNENEKYETIKFLDTGKVIIDCDKNNTLVIENSDIYLSDNEYKEIRKKISKIKNKDLNIGGIIENNNNDYFNFQQNNNEDLRSIDYKLSKLFSETIYQKMMNEKDSLTIDIRIEKYFMNFKKEYLLDNQSPQSIMKNEFMYRDEQSFYNSLIITFYIFNFPFEKAKEFLNGIDSFDNMIEDYNYMKNIICENNDLKEDEDNEDLINNVQMNFYGENGVLHFYNIIQEKIGDKENDFYNKCYIEYIFEYIKKYFNHSDQEEDNLEQIEENNSKQIEDFKNNNNNNNNNNNLIIEFSMNEPNEPDCHKSPNFYLYIAYIFQKMKESNIYSEIIKNSEFNHKIINCYNISYNKNKYNFPFFDFYSFLISLNLSEINQINYSETKESNSDLEKIFEKSKDYLKDKSSEKQ